MVLKVQSANLPLLPDNRYVVWRNEWRGRRWEKVPYQPTNPAVPASVADADTWGTREQALAVYQLHGFDGIAYVLTGDGLIFIDFDNCRDPKTGIITPWAQPLINPLDTYAEVSPSGTGVHVIVESTTLPLGGNSRPYEDGKVEMYWNSRMATMTGHVITDRPVRDQTEKSMALHQALFPAIWTKPQQSSAIVSAPPVRTPRTTPLGQSPVRPSAIWTPRIPPLGPGETGVLRRTRKNKNFAKLAAGDLSAYPTRSEADQAFITHLLRNGATVERADRLMRNSRLYRPTWDEQRGQHTYGERTILTAMATVDVHVPPILNPNEDLGAIVEVLANPAVRNEAQTLVFLAIDIACRVNEPAPTDGWWLVRPRSLGWRLFHGIPWDAGTVIRHLHQLAALGGISANTISSDEVAETLRLTGQKVSAGTYVQVQGRTIPSILAPFFR